VSCALRSQDTHPITPADAAQRPVAPLFAGRGIMTKSQQAANRGGQTLGRKAFESSASRRSRIRPKGLRARTSAARAHDWSQEQLRSCLLGSEAQKQRARVTAAARGRTAANVSLTHRCRPRVSYSHNHRVRPTAEGFHYRADPHAIDAATDVRPLRLLVALRAAELRTQQ
jgi:hypothetical protein